MISGDQNPNLDSIGMELNSASNIKHGTMSLIVCEAFNLSNILGIAMSVQCRYVAPATGIQIQPPELKALGFMGSISVSNGF